MINEDKPIWTATAISAGILVAWGLLLLHRVPRKSTEPKDSVAKSGHRWLRWRWIAVVLLYLFGGLCLLGAFLGAIWFDGEEEVFLWENHVHGWRLWLWELFCTWPVNGIKGCLAIYAGWSIWRTNWKATRRAIVLLALLLALAAVANYLVMHVLSVF
jgi:hypothetical protein